MKEKMASGPLGSSGDRNKWMDLGNAVGMQIVRRADPLDVCWRGEGATAVRDTCFN